MAGVIDATNLGYLWSKIKSYVASQIQAVGALTGVKGAAESAYRTGNVSISPEDIGAHRTIARVGTTDYDPKVLRITAGNNIAFGTVGNDDERNVAINLDEVGDTYDGSSSHAISTASIDTLTAGPSVTLPYGKYVIMGQWSFSGRSSNSVCQCAIGTSASNLYRRHRIVNASTNYCTVQCSCIRSITETTTVHLYGSCSSAASSAQTQYITAIRIT